MTKLVDDRNVKMMERLKPFMIQGQVPFLTVGTAHLLGPKGLLEAFRAAGYEVSQL
jgi:uncharacterized protein YbaP (TraB family)